ncbi:MAG: C25 family cysteine peptidase, partial [Candidatus Krumholzibacteria bacterium]|nr:C25 family cysteine peptidase [Candidatus Krumholzibacteria bacterium]
MKSILSGILLLTSLFSPVYAGEWLHEESLAAHEILISQDRDGSGLEFPSSLCLEAPGSPALPGRILRIPLPEGQRLSSFRYELPAASLIMGDLPLPGLRSDQGDFAGPAEGIPEGSLVLLSQPGRRGIREAHFYWRPLKIESGQLSLDPELRLYLTSEADPEPPLPVLRADRGVELFFQPSDRPGLDGSAVDALILTNEEMLPAFEILADWHLERGSRTVVRSLEWVAENYPPGADPAENLRIFLQDAYQFWGIHSLLIGGDTSEIPVRYSTIRIAWEEKEVPTDLYYSCLDGNWNGDGDEHWGEGFSSASNPGDDADFLPELLVGRVPVSSFSDAESYVSKLLAYRESPPDADFQDQILFFAEVLFPKTWYSGLPILTDGADFPVKIIENYLEDDLNYTCLFENYQDSVSVWQTIPLDPLPVELTVEAAVDSMSTGHFALVDQNGHGFRNNMSVGDGNITLSHAQNLTNPNGFHITLMNCTSTAFDYDCLGENFLRNPDGGAVSVFGTTRESFPSYTEPYYKRFYDMLFSGQVSNAGKVFDSIRWEMAASAQGNSYFRWTYLIVTYLGDPLMDPWCGEPLEYNVTAPAEIWVGDSLLDFHVDDSLGSASSKVRITLQQGDDLWVSGTTDAAGDLTLPVFLPSEGNLELCAWGHNGVLLRDTLTVLPSEDAELNLATWSFSDDLALDPANDGDGLADAGEVLSLNLLLENAGGSDASGLTIGISSSHDSLQVLQSEELLGELPSGATVSSTTLQIRSAVGLEDGSRLALLLSLSASDLPTRQDTLFLSFQAPELRCSGWTLDDSGDGILDPGESFRAIPRLVNVGQGETTSLSLHLEALEPGVSVEEGSLNLVSLSLLEEGEAGPGFLLSLDDPEAGIPALFTVMDEMGRVFQDTLDFMPPDPPGQPVSAVSTESGRIDLSWDASQSEDVASYHVYLALEGDPAFSRYTLLPVEYRGMAVRNLPENSLLQFTVTALDSSGFESLPSDTLQTSTNPAQLAGFPHILGQSCGSSVALGNISGDEAPELVVASDYLYAWFANGDEVLDGDNSTGTTGVLTQAANDVAGSVTLAPLLGTETLQIVVAARGSSPPGLKAIYAFDGEGNVLPGWPRETEDWIWGNLLAEDLDGDGDLEIAGVDNDGIVYAFHHDGSELVDGDADPSSIGVLARGIGAWSIGSPAAADLNGDGAKELLISSRDNLLHAFQSDGSEASGFPVSGSLSSRSPLVVADLMGDGAPEILFLSASNALHAIGFDGVEMAGFPLSYPNDFGSTGPSPVPVDLDGDGVMEIFLPRIVSENEETHLHLIDLSGNEQPGWPIILETSMQSSPVVGDIDGDGSLEFIIGSEDGTVFGFNVDGSIQPGFPIKVGGEVRGAPALGDLDSDGDVDLILASWNRGVFAWDFEGRFDLENFPWPTQSGNYRRTGRLGDADSFDKTPPQLSLAVFQNPYLDQYLDLYVTADEDLKVESVELLAGVDTLEVHAVSGEGGLYRADYELTDEGLLHLETCAEDLFGNAACGELEFSSSFVLASEGVHLRDGMASLLIEPGSLSQD